MQRIPVNNRNVGLLGGGFSLYGYLPAFIANGFAVITLSKYKDLIESRIEIRDYIGQIEFVESEQVVVENSDFLAMARTPRGQSEFCHNNLESLAKLRHVFLEKPLATDQEEAFKLLAKLDQHKINFSVAYLFEHTSWFGELQNRAQRRDSDYLVSWDIPIVENSWKNSLEHGGGLVNYYAIHLAHLISKLKLHIDVKKSFIGKDNIQLKLDGAVSLGIEVKMTDAMGRFALTRVIVKSKQEVFSSDTPLGERPRKGLSDPRIPFLEEYVKKHLYSSASSANLELEYRIWGVMKELENLSIKNK